MAASPLSSGFEPQPDEMRASLQEIDNTLKEAATQREPGFGHGIDDYPAPRLVGISKTKTVQCLRNAYDAGLRVFGENYVHEIVEKAPQLPDDIEWHFVGHLQSNKVKTVLSTVPSLAVLETVDSVKLADKLNKGCADYRGGKPALKVYVQVNTSGEESKSGVEPGQPVIDLAKHIVDNCTNLAFGGLMTIGMPDYTSKPENFECLWKCREEVAAALGITPSHKLELSMGMSGDFANAVRMGSTNVRVGSKIFGARNYASPSVSASSSAASTPMTPATPFPDPK